MDSVVFVQDWGPTILVLSILSGFAVNQFSESCRRTGPGPLHHFRPVPFFAGFAARSSRSSRAAVRFFAAASEAVFARADRCSGVMFFAAFLPPWRPKVRAISVIAARTSGGIFMPIPQIVYLTGYGTTIQESPEELPLHLRG